MGRELPLCFGLRMFLDSTGPTACDICNLIGARPKRSSLRELLVAKRHLSEFRILPTADMTSKPREYTSKQTLRSPAVPVSAAAAESPATAREFADASES